MLGIGPTRGSSMTVAMSLCPPPTPSVRIGLAPTHAEAFLDARGQGTCLAARACPSPARPEWVHQFLVVLTGTDPLIWRRIQVPLDHSFWDLHVAIQDAMG
jgi:hypothetical protein